MLTRTTASTHMIIIVLLLTSPLRADILRGDDLEITDIYTDLDEWLSVVPSVAIIDFTEFEQGTVITDQYADLGVNFVDGLYFIHHASAFTDQFGLSTNPVGVSRIIMEFDQPFNIVGSLFPGVKWYEFYLDGEFVGWTEEQGFSGPGNFTGFILDTPFDEVHVIHFGGSSSSSDNLYFTFDPIPAPGSLALLGIAGFAFRRTRCRR